MGAIPALFAFPADGGQVTSPAPGKASWTQGKGEPGWCPEPVPFLCPSHQRRGPAHTPSGRAPCQRCHQEHQVLGTSARCTQGCSGTDGDGYQGPTTLVQGNARPRGGAITSARSGSLLCHSLGHGGHHSIDGNPVAGRNVPRLGAACEPWGRWELAPGSPLPQQLLGHPRTKQSPAGSVFVGRQQGNALLNLLISRGTRRARGATPTLPAAQGRGALGSPGAGRAGTLHPHLCSDWKAARGRACHLSAVARRFLFVPGVTGGTSPCIINPQSHTSLHVTKARAPWCRL